MGFLDNIFNDDKKKKKPSGGGLQNPFANMGNNNNRRAFHGGGQSLGGTQPGAVLEISLVNPGPLGLRVEKRPNSMGTAIVNEVVVGSQAETAGVKRGDILCFAGSNGQEEMMYDMFLEIAKSADRPIHLEVRRLEATKSNKPLPSAPKNVSAEADLRRQAVIAAAEAREKAHKKWTKPIKGVTKTTLLRKQQQQATQEVAGQEHSNEPLSQEAAAAAAAAKQGEADLAAQLGYNPYETARSTAGQARTATTTTQHGTIAAAATNSNNAADHQTGNHLLPSVALPREAAVPTSEEDLVDFPIEFEDAYTTLVSANEEASVVKSSANILTKLIVNATTKGQTPGEDSAKFRKVRLANAKIKAAVVDVQGAVELLLAVGFCLNEQDGESVLIYPADCPGPDWLPTALKQMENA